MKCQLVGYNEFSIIKDKETGESDEALTLHFIRNPSLRESGAVGKVAVSCTVYGDSVKKVSEKVELKVGTTYECDINSFKGKNYLNDIAPTS